MAANTGVYPFTEQRPSYHMSPYYEVLGAVAASLAAIALLAKLLRFWLRSRKDALEAERRRVRLAGVGSGHGVGAPRQQPPVPASVAGEMAQAMGPLVCTYLKADGWPAEAACAVCLAELDDGEAVRVLPVCMHYFHTACVSEWLRTHHTCPLCHAPLAPPAAVDDATAADDAAAA